MSSVDLSGCWREFRELRASDPTALDAVGAWNSRARALTFKYSVQLAEAEVPPEFWHYLHDAHTRIKDPEYRISQNKQFSRLIQQLEFGIVPQTRSVSVPIPKFWVVAVTVAVAVAVVLMVGGLF